MTKDELIRALEAATGPSRELDDAIWAIQKGYEVRWIPGERPYFLVPRCYCTNTAYHAEGAPHWKCFHPGEGGTNYTASIDAALTLVPEGCEWSRHRGANGRMTMQVDGPGVVGQHGQAATPAIALAIAALKARP